MPKATIVVPCFNEAERLDTGAFLSFLGLHEDVDFLFVDDGSDDDTPRVLADLAGRSPRIRWVGLPENLGKAEAVRLGVQQVLGRSEPGFVGYWDADLATPLSEIPGFIEVLEQNGAIQTVFGARVQLLGRVISRNALRHYFGRVFATAASMTLNVPIYDTQCGAKLFRGDELTRHVFEQPFRTRWVFDVELLARIARRSGGSNALLSAVYERPLKEWTDVPGSKVRAKDAFQAFWHLWKINARYRLRRNAFGRRSAGTTAERAAPQGSPTQR